MAKLTRPLSPRRFRQLAAQIRRGRVEDYELLFLCESNPFYQVQLKAVLDEPRLKAEQLQREKDDAIKAAKAAFKHTLRNTVRGRREALEQRSIDHSAQRYIEFLRELEEASERAEAARKQHEIDQRKWDRFCVSVLELRVLNAAGWVSRADLPRISQLIWDSNPFKVTEWWPDWSCCPVDPKPQNNPQSWKTETYSL